MTSVGLLARVLVSVIHVVAEFCRLQVVAVIATPIVTLLPVKTGKQRANETGHAMQSRSKTNGRGRREKFPWEMFPSGNKTEAVVI